MSKTSRPSLGLHMLLSTARVAASTSHSYASRSTFLSTFLFIPLLDIALPVLMGYAMGAPTLAPIAQAGVLLSSAVLAMTQVVMTCAHDRSFRILHLVMRRARFPMAYWVGILLPACAVATGSGISCLMFTQLWTGFASLPWLLLFPTVLCGAFLGIFLAGWGILLNDVYAPLNGLSPFLALITGLLVPYEAYPPFFAFVLPYAPLASLIQAVRSSDGIVSIWSVLSYDLGLCALCALCGLGLGSFFFHRIRAGANDDMP